MLAHGEVIGCKALHFVVSVAEVAKLLGRYAILMRLAHELGLWLEVILEASQACFLIGPRVHFLVGKVSLLLEHVWAPTLLHIHIHLWIELVGTSVLCYEVV